MAVVTDFVRWPSLRHMRQQKIRQKLCSCAQNRWGPTWVQCLLLTNIMRDRCVHHSEAVSLLRTL